MKGVYIHHAHNAESILPEPAAVMKQEETVCCILFDLRKVDEAVSIAYTVPVLQLTYSATCMIVWKVRPSHNLTTPFNRKVC